MAKKPKNQPSNQEEVQEEVVNEFIESPSNPVIDDSSSSNNVSVEESVSEEPQTNDAFEGPDVPGIEEAFIEETKRDLPVYPVTLLRGVQFDLYNKLNNSAQVAFTKVLYYVDKMAPGKMLSNQDINDNQVSLYSGICSILNEKEQFHEKMHLLLQIFDDHANGAFKETHVMRNMHSVELDRDDLLLFQTLVTAFRVLAPMKTRALKLKTVDLSRRLFSSTMTVRVTEEARQRLLTYFDIENN